MRSLAWVVLIAEEARAGARTRRVLFVSKKGGRTASKGRAGMLNPSSWSSASRLSLNRFFAPLYLPAAAGLAMASCWGSNIRNENVIAAINFDDVARTLSNRADWADRKHATGNPGVFLTPSALMARDAELVGVPWRSLWKETGYRTSS